MRASLLHVVTAYSNPMRWRSRPRLYRDFERHMLDSGVALHTVELAHGDRPFEISEGREASRHVDYIQVRCTGGPNGWVWHKEALLNAGFRHVPSHVDRIGWADADVSLDRPDWAIETVHALEAHPIVQPWSDGLDLGASGEILRHVQSFAWLWMTGAPIQALDGPAYAYGHTGFFWAARRSFLEQVGGLIDRAALGAADWHMALALVGAGARSVHGQATPAYREMVLSWEGKAQRAGGINLGAVPATTLRHHFHGHKDLRRYVGRWDILIRHGYDPAHDAVLNLDGVIELSGSKPGLGRDIHAYFRDRREDDSVL
jgi:hypothetical protein